MTPDKDTIRHLNAALRNKLTAINQYFLHARMLKHAGDVKLADHEYKASLGAMKHSDMLVEHILSLGGTPNLQDLGRLSIGENSHDMLCNDLTLAESMSIQLRGAIAFCESRQQPATVALLAKILEGQQEHAAFIRAQLAGTERKPSQLIKDCA